MGIISNFIERRIRKDEMSKFLNVSNIENFRKRDEKIISRNIDKAEWNKHKRDVFALWMNSKSDFNKKHQVKAKRIIKRLDIKLDDEIEKTLLALERREFTTRRAFKEIEIPFASQEGFEGKVALFVYKDVRMYDNNSKLLTLITSGDLYILPEQLVWYDNKTEEILFTLRTDQVREMNLYDYGLELIAGAQSMLLRYKDNNVIKISLDKLWKKGDITTGIYTREVKLIKEN